MRAEGAALSAASQWDGRNASCRIKHESEYTAGDRSAAVNAAADNTAVVNTAVVNTAVVNTAVVNTAVVNTAVVDAGDDNAADDGVWAAGQEEQRRFATAEVSEP
jgi:hypothetical protein